MKRIISGRVCEMNTLGNGIIKDDGCVVFCIGAADGDVISAQIAEEKKNYKTANIVELKEPSPYRQEPDCPAFGKCGGCTLRHITYEHEAEIKRKSVENALRRGGLGNVEVDEIITADPDRYRNKAVYRFTTDGKAGYSEALSHSITPVSDCLLCPPVFSQTAALTADFFKSSGTLPEYLYIRSNRSCSELNVVIGLPPKCGADIKSFAELLRQKIPAVCGILAGTGKTPEESRGFKLIRGVPYISESFAGLKIKISPASFFQVNYDAAEKLAQKAAQLACPSPGEYGADLYCGTGIMGMVCAKEYPQAFITGVEINEQAVLDAKENAAANSLGNLGFYSGDSADFVKSAYGSIDFAIIDPPRAGCSEKMLHELVRLNPRHIVYISCSPSTLARDLKALTQSCYELASVSACDLFPRTKHCEAICKLVRRK